MSGRFLPWYVSLISSTQISQDRTYNITAKHSRSMLEYLDSASVSDPATPKLGDKILTDDSGASQVQGLRLHLKWH